MQALNEVYKFLKVVQQYPDILSNLIDSVSEGQLKSKQWIINEIENLNIDLGVIFLCAGWYSTLAHMLFESNIKFTKIRSFDVDPYCEKIAEIINKENVIDNWAFKSSTLDIHDMKYDNFTYNTFRKDGSSLLLTDTADTIINTSCEHIKKFEEWYDKIPAGKLIILQNNNYLEVADHINCVTSLSEFEQQSNMTNLLYQGELKLDKYVRYMRIGIK